MYFNFRTILILFWPDRATYESNVVIFKGLEFFLNTFPMIDYSGDSILDFPRMTNENEVANLPC